MMKKINLRAKGFTLIELLVVISIIGLLSSIVLVSLNSARGKARDAKRLAEKAQVITALNLYYNDFGKWPDSAADARCFGAPTIETCYLGGQTGLDSLVTAMQPYMSSFPTNNANTGTIAYNRILYQSSSPAGWPVAGTSAGAWLIWFQESNILSKCPGGITNTNGGYWYCFEYLGPP